MAANSGHRDPLASTDRFAPDTSRLTAPQPASRVERLLPRKETDSKRPLRDLRQAGFSAALLPLALTDALKDPVSLTKLELRRFVARHACRAAQGFIATGAAYSGEGLGPPRHNFTEPQMAD